MCQQCRYTFLDAHITGQRILSTNLLFHHGLALQWFCGAGVSPAIWRAFTHCEPAGGTPAPPEVQCALLFFDPVIEGFLLLDEFPYLFADDLGSVDVSICIRRRILRADGGILRVLVGIGNERRD